MIRRALLSVSDKTGIVDLARSLNEMGIEIISTGGTARAIESAGIPVRKVEEITGFPEMLDGRVKTLHPAIHGGILALRNEGHLRQIREHGIEPIDMVVVNLYPFEKVARDENAGTDDLIENIDIGGPTLIRSAAKNHENVVVVSNPDRYDEVTEAIIEEGDVPPELREELALEAFAHTAAYDSIIYSVLSKRFTGKKFPEHLFLHYLKVQGLRYGENKEQEAAFYRDPEIIEPCIASARQLHGKAMSYNNILDTNDALELIKDFDEPTVAAIKHTNPCGVSSADDIYTAFRRAMDADPMSAYGGILASNREITYDIVKDLKGMFLEVIIAPSYEEKALQRLMKRKNLRILETGPLEHAKPAMDYRKVVGGMLAQDRDISRLEDASKLKVVSERAPTEREIRDMLFAWRVTKHVKSNSIVFAKDSTTAGIGAGQMSRVDAVRIASFKGGERTEGAVMSSDAFFPFRDGIDEAHKAGITAVIHPGGSIRDEEVIEAANEYGMAMVFTGYRVFKH